MNDITLTISVSAAEAAKAGVDHYGDTPVTLAPSALSGLARELLAYLLRQGKPVTSTAASAVYGCHVLPVPMQPAPETVAQWLEATAAADAAYEAQQKASREARLEQDRKVVRAWLDKDDGAIIGCSNRDNEWVVNTPYDPPVDMQELVAKRKAKAQVLADARNAEAVDRKSVV